MGLLRAQAAACRTLEVATAAKPLSGRLTQDVDQVLSLREGLFGALAACAPPEMSEEIGTRALEPASTAASRLDVYWSDEPEARDDYLARVLLRPYVESLACLGIAPDRLHRNGRCPFCGGPPVISSRRSEPDSHGAQRHLGCALCGGEWGFNRIRCPSCDEDDPEKLPTFQGAPHPLVRIEACDVCKRYVKSIDLTLDARPIPEVDDLVSISLDLWALEQGYSRIEPGIAGI